MDIQHLTTQRDRMTDKWFNSLSIGDRVHNYSLKWKNKEIIDKKLREGIIKEIYNGNQFSRYVIVDNLTTGRQNKWNDYDLVKPLEIQNVEEQLLQQLSATTSSQLPDKPHTLNSVSAKMAQQEYEQLVENANLLLDNKNIQLGNCAGIYAAFNKNSGECIYIGKSKKTISTRWREHARYWKKLRPIHRQPLFTQYLYFFKEQIEWRVLLPVQGDIDNDLLEYSERRLFEQYHPIANTIIPNGTYYGRSVLENEGESISVSEWNPDMITIKIHKGGFNGFSDGKAHFQD